MKRRGILIKMLVLVAISVLAFCGIGIYGVLNSKKIYQAVDQVRVTAEEFQRGTLQITEPLNKLRRLMLTMVMAPNRELQAELNEEQQELTATIDRTIATWRLSNATQAERDAFKQLKTSWNNYKSLKNVTADKVLSGYREEAFINAIRSEKEQFELLTEQVKSWTGAVIANAENVNQQAQEEYDNALWISTVVSVVMTVVVGAFGLITTRIIVVPIQKLKNAATAIARHAFNATGEVLDEKIEVKSADELGELAAAFNQMVENLRSAMNKLKVEESRTQAILDSTADGIVTINEQGKVLTFNQAAESIFKYDSTEIAGADVSRVIPSMVDGDGSLKQTETYGVDRDGKQIPITLRVSEMEYLNERLRIATLDDITAKKAAEQERSQIATAIRDAVNRLASTSKQITKIAERQTSGARQQTEAVKATLATSSEVSATADQAAGRADRVAESAQQANNVGKAGREAVEDSVAAMATLKDQVSALADNILSLAEKAQKIGEITETVNDIAEQTNVLALNAAVEASRAGEHGKGFAVVASEIKQLAEQSKTATGQVREILTEIQQATNSAVLSTEQGTKSVNEASKVVQDAGDTIASLSETLADSARLARQISASAQQQSTGIMQLNESMQNIDSVTQENVTTIEQIEKAARDLNALSNELASLTSESIAT